MLSSTEMNHSISNYYDTIKSNFLFGGIKLFQIIINLLRTKLVAVILGPSGIGLISLFTNTVITIHQFTTFGIFQSSIKYITYNAEKSSYSKIINIINNLALVVGLLGMMICIIFSKTISILVFNSKEHNIAFIIIALALLFESLSNGIITCFQGLRKLSQLAISSLLGAIISITISIPIYLWIGEKGIPIGIVLTYGITYSIYLITAIKAKIKFKYNFNITSSIKHGIPIIKLGIIIMFSNGLMTLFTLILNSYINRHGSPIEVGFYQAAVTATYGNIAILISILSSDFYPKLASTINKNININLLVNQQVELLLLITAPIIGVIVLFPDFIIKILFTQEFISISPLLQIMAISLIFRIIWHSLSYVILAHGDKITYLVYDAIIGNGLIFILNLLGYYYMGLFGLSLSFLFGSIFMVILLNLVTLSKYKLKLTPVFWSNFLIFLSLCIASYYSIKLFNNIHILIKIWFCTIILGFTFFILNKRLNIIGKFKRINDYQK